MENRTKNYCWAIIFAVLTIATIVIMYLAGMSDVINFSPPFDVGFNQYIDIRAGVIFCCFIGIGFIIYFSLRKGKG